MSTNIGIGFSGSFKKMINPIVLNSYQLVTPPEDIGQISNFDQFLESDSLVNKILRVIQSLDTHDSTDSLTIDANPLDNIIRGEIINLLNFRKISKIKVQNALDLVTEGQDPNNIFNIDESILLLNQAKNLELISDEIYTSLLSSPNTLSYSYPVVYKKLLVFQLGLPNNIPTIEELKIAGIVDFIIETVKNNPEIVVDELILKEYTKEYIDDILMTSEFIGYHTASSILADPENILNIISKISFNNLAKRVMPYFSFITQEKINLVMDYIPSQYQNIVNVFSREQIRLMIDKELDIKNIILKTLSLTEVQNTFNTLAQQFKIDFATTFTEEKLIDLIKLAITNLYPEKDISQIYDTICANYSITTNNLDLNLIEARINKYFI